jgi:hypothetical protein
MVKHSTDRQTLARFGQFNGLMELAVLVPPHEAKGCHLRWKCQGSLPCGHVVIKASTNVITSSKGERV